MALRGFARYLRHQFRLASVIVRESMAGTAAPDLPLPPPRLRHRVHGAMDATSFLQVGSRCAADVAILAKDHDRDFAAYDNVLDFGCGCGRTLRHFEHRPPTQHLHGTDIDASAIRWCQEHLHGLAAWNVNAVLPPTSYPDATFDLIYAISVFTHIDEATQFAWLRELNRIAKPGARLILTVHGEHVYRHSLGPDDLSVVERQGFLFRVKQTGRWKLDGLPDWYQTSFHTKDYVASHWSRLFDVVSHVERGMAGYQDAVVLSKPLDGVSMGHVVPQAR